MKALYSIILYLISNLDLNAQSESCDLGSAADGHCGFYKDVSFEEPVDLVSDGLILNTENRYAYRDYSDEVFNYFLIGMYSETEEGISLFYDAEFQMLDKTGEVIFTQFCHGPDAGVVTDQEVYRNEGAVLRIYYAGDKQGDLHFRTIKSSIKQP
ncbi:MAG: hypothetical protein AAGC88_03600 [Bacteroidota bacterium]